MGEAGAGDVLDTLFAVIERRKGGDPNASYVARSFARGTEHIAKKVGEEGVETALAGALGDLHGAEITITLGETAPPVVNTGRETAVARRAAQAVVGAAAVVEQDHPSMGAEDFSYYLREIPGCYVRFGSRPDGGGYVPLHSPLFDVDEQVLKVGAGFLDHVAREAAGAAAADAAADGGAS